jgi:hypothetical protein
MDGGSIPPSSTVLAEQAVVAPHGGECAAGTWEACDLYLNDRSTGQRAREGP